MQQPVFLLTMSEIKHYINSPEINAKTAPELKLYRPKINYGYAVLYVFLHILVSYAAAICVYRFRYHTFSNCLTGSLKYWWILPIAFAITLRFTFIWFVRLYQRYARSEVRLRCCMQPSCSHYSILALKKYGAVIGTIKTFRRLMRCKPPGYIDYP